MSKKAGKIAKGFRNFIKYLRKGGVTYVNVVTVAPGQMLAGKTALVTGGSSGIGKAIAKAFLEQGAEVVISGRDSKALQEVKEELNSPFLHIIQGDVADVKTTDGFLEKCKRLLFGKKIDILVNNAGVTTHMKAEDMIEEEWDRIVNTNLKGLYFMCKIYIDELLRNSATGKIINLSSVFGVIGDEGPYGASKHGVISVTRGLAKKYRQAGINVNAIAPGPTVSNIVPLGQDSDNYYAENNPCERILLPEEIAQVALFLASDTSNSIVGQTIVVDGGMTL